MMFTKTFIIHVHDKFQLIEPKRICISIYHIYFKQRKFNNFICRVLLYLFFIYQLSHMLI
jgi:hypothetical protein